MPKEWTHIGQSAEAFNEVSGGGLENSGFHWLADKVGYGPGNEANLGARKDPVPPSGTTLYESYVNYAESHGIEPIPFNNFAAVLEDSIRSLGYRDVVLKRRAHGIVLVGLVLGNSGEPTYHSRVLCE